MTPRQADYNVVLIGYRACGKSSVGGSLARILNRPFIDLDQVLVEEAGQSIASIVAQSGWPEFRRREKALVARYARKKRQVLAPGGGVVLDPENVDLLKENGVIIWLTAVPAAIRDRLARDESQAASRPSLTAADTLSEVEAVLETREPLYRGAAHLIIDTTESSVPQVVEQILAALAELHIHEGGGQGS